MSGLFISFEGPEGGGKTVQIERLAAFLESAGHKVVRTREPGGTPLGDRVRSIFLDADDLDLRPETEVFLLAAARAQHVREVIQPALAQGTTVLCDRYVDSTYAYQGAGLDIPDSVLDPIQSLATNGVLPDLRVLLDVPVKVGLARRHAEAGSVNRIDKKAVAFHERVRAGFLKRANANPDGWVVVDASAPIEDVTRSILDAVQAWLAGVPDNPMASVAYT